ncbi:PAS domain-containing hybrid sensor histidine kinase/response regulator [Anatilimnocola floriformis]|uniref:PAS domain-containing hybrid sensor histidine kinase/response regulator n=1 Tax=Anatilimnocola floriformis TaxID=2948575 RepID=UPI0020C380EF|nr:ATP-binding protein [Anatilimnocola floriformis]
MDPTADAVVENRQLRRTMRDLVALSTLPAIWTGLGPEGIVRSLADALLGMLTLEFAYVRCAGPTAQSPLEVIRTRQRGDSQELIEIVRAVSDSATTEKPISIPDPAGNGTLLVAVTRFGIGEDCGVLVTASRTAEYPSERDRLLLGVGANQTSIVLGRLRTEAALRAREDRYRVLVTATADVVYRMSADWSEMQPLDGRGLVASNSAPIRNWLTKNIPESEHDVVRETFGAAIANRQTFELEHRVYRPDGSVGWTFSRAVPIVDAEGQIIEWFGTARDVTAQRQASEVLTRATAATDRQRRLYEAILSGTPDLIYIFGLDYSVLYANDALLAMWGRTMADTIGKGLLELGYEPWHAEMHWREIDQVRATKQPIRGEVPFNGTNGRRIYDYIFVPVFDADGEVEAVAGTTRDVTDRKNMEDELRRLAATLSDADHRKDEFLATLAHELRNPLAPIRNGLQILKLVQNDPESREQSRAMMERQVDQLVRLVDDLLDVSRISRGKMELRREHVLLVDVLASAVETSRPLIEQMGHELTITPPTQTVIVDGDLTRLAQVFLNLLNNAAKYSERGGRITLTAELRGTNVVVSVRDTGIGIAPEQLPRIFEMFSQVDQSLEKSQGGLGIGLTLVRRLVEMHGGSVEARSEGPGRGSEFIVQLPVVVADSAVPTKKNESTSKSSLRILIVDDNRDSAMSLAKMLKYLGNETHTANDGEEAIAATTEFEPQVILLDIGLPKLNGYEACRRIRKLPRGQEMLIIAQTGWGQEEDRQRTRDAGFDHHLVKPVEISKLMKLLADWVPNPPS